MNWLPKDFQPLLLMFAPYFNSSESALVLLVGAIFSTWKADSQRCFANDGLNH
ncbi:MAG: hypothetical protein HC936_16550 [Leptolyngbyaceae cyanobacterium SU_3_3]|nr:hypothetical protein [Leptolyngbyaceae cyanobacterium SU_3_3]